MNLFLLSEDTKKCAEEHCDKHIVKMPVELTQMLYTAHHMNDKFNGAVRLYYNAPNNGWKRSFINHPTAIWVRSGIWAYTWTCLLAAALCKEYTYRYDREHGCQKHVEWLRKNLPTKWPRNGPDYSVCTTPPTIVQTPFKNFPLCMPEQYKGDDAIESYRQYYIGDKEPFAKWRRRPAPDWWPWGLKFIEKMRNIIPEPPDLLRNL